MIVSIIREKWNLLIEASLIIYTLLSFTSAPTFDPESLYGQGSIAAYSKFIIAATLALSLVPCSIFIRRKFVWRWWTAALLLLIIGLCTHFYYNNCISNLVVNTEEFGYGKLVRGDNYNREVENIRGAYFKRYGTYPSDKKLIAGFQGDHLRIWAKNEIIANTNRLVILYILTIISLTSFIVFSTQAFYCLTKRSAK